LRLRAVPRYGSLGGAPQPPTAIITSARIAAVVLTYGTDDLHLPLLANLAACELVSDVVVVHNPRDPAEGDPRILGAARLHRQERNRGYAGGMNAGIERALEADPAAVLLLTHDALVTCQSIEKLMDTLSEHGAGIVGPVLRTPDSSRLWSVGKRDTRMYATKHITSVASDETVARRSSIDGSVMLISRTVAERVRFNEDLFMYYDDSEYCLRARRAGYSVLVAMQAEASSVPGGPSRPSAHAYLMARNRLHYAREHGRAAALGASFGSLYAVLMALPKPGGTRFPDRGLRHASVSSARAIALGLVDYWRGRTGPPPEVVARGDR
jgi:GT2 family glycosyltransferase